MSGPGDGRPLSIVHFTPGATDPLQGFRAHGVRVVMLADGAGADETYVSCLHFEPGGWVTDPPTGRDSTILVIYGEVILHERDRMRLELSSGVGVVMNADVRYRLESETGAILLVVESERLEATECGISTPERIMGQLWPGESLVKRPRTLLSLYRSILYRVRWWRSLRRLARIDLSGWDSIPACSSPVRRFLSACVRKRG